MNNSLATAEYFYFESTNYQENNLSNSFSLQLVCQKVFSLFECQHLLLTELWLMLVFGYIYSLIMFSNNGNKFNYIFYLSYTRISYHTL